MIFSSQSLRTTRLSSFPHHLCLSFFRTCVAGYAQARLRSLSLSWGFGCPVFVKTARRSIFFKTKMKAEKNLKFCYSNIQTSNFKVQASNSYSKPAPNSKFFKIQDSDFSYSRLFFVVPSFGTSNAAITTSILHLGTSGGGHGYGLYGSMGRYVVLCGSVLFSRWGQVNKPNVTGEALRAVWRQSRTNAEKSRWWRTTSPETKEDETTREAATGGETPLFLAPARKNIYNWLIRVLDYGGVWVEDLPRGGFIRDKATITDREKQREREQQTGEDQLSPARQQQTSKTNLNPAPFGGGQ
ncbi:hypothetical protein C8J57DRAFT_1665076 [Mycena rebaudengoi]|nr:hypothetical protein C8J57DRAFT_1665076 [Mycena rebaudengoi]